jgi:LuxR family maltose regulon positive regulatory protein
MAGEVATLAGWLAAIQPYTRSRPWLAMQMAWVLLLTGRTDRASQAIELGEQLLSDVEPGDRKATLQGCFTSGKAHLENQRDNPGIAAEYARQALACLPETNDFSCSLRSVAVSLLGDASRAQGKMILARAAYTEAVRIGQAAGASHMVILSNLNLASVLYEQGQFRQAARLYSDTLELAEQVDGPDSVYTLDIHLGFGRLNYAWNHLEEALGWINRCMDLGRKWGELNQDAACLALKARVEAARYEPEREHQVIQTIEDWWREKHLSPEGRRQIGLVLGRWWIDQGKPEKTGLLLQEMGIGSESPLVDQISEAAQDPDEPFVYRDTPVYLLWVRYLLAQDLVEAALNLNERLLRDARAGDRLRTLTELLVLQALALQTSRDKAGALAAIEEALRLAWPEENKRVFLDEGPGLENLLIQAKVRHTCEEFATGLLDSIDQTANPATKTDSPDQTRLVEPLSPRELEVLRWMAEGCANQEIARRFVISPMTVKRHISNIYGKLDVKNRVQAIALARALKLIK